jgi:dolichol-phosphate mannosyltransferase
LVTPSVLVIVPTYNEALTIQEVVQRLRASSPSVDILIVDDSSPDNTGAIADGLADAKTFVLHRPEKAGLGPAYLAGFTWGILREYQYFVEMDADGSHQPEELNALLEAGSGSDLVIGTRWMPGGRVINWPLSRRFISRFGTQYASLALHLPYRDLTSGFRVLSRQLVTDILEAKLSTIGYGFQIEIVRIAVAKGRVILEIPITFVERLAGSSKMSKWIVFEAWRKTTLWGFQRIVNRR